MLEGAKVPTLPASKPNLYYMKAIYLHEKVKPVIPFFLNVCIESEVFRKMVSNGNKIFNNPKNPRSFIGPQMWLKISQKPVEKCTKCKVINAPMSRRFYGK